MRVLPFGLWGISRVRRPQGAPAQPEPAAVPPKPPQAACPAGAIQERQAPALYISAASFASSASARRSTMAKSVAPM